MSGELNELEKMQYQLFLKQLELKLEEYEQLVLDKEKQGLLAPNTRATYLLHANNFVRWCNNDFIPGE